MKEVRYVLLLESGILSVYMTLVCILIFIPCLIYYINHLGRGDIKNILKPNTT